MNGTQGSRASGLINPRFALAAAALLGLLVAQVIGAVGANAGSQAGTSASVTKQIKKLKQRVTSLEKKQAYPPNGAAGGELTGSYPNPSVADNLGFTQLSIDGPCPGGHTGSCPGSWNSDAMTLTRKDGSPTEVTYTGTYNGEALIYSGSNGDHVFLSGAGFLEMKESGISFNPPANEVLIYPRDSGGLTQLVARFNDGDIDVLAQEAP